MNRLIITKSKDPWHNLALEELLFGAQGALPPGSVTLYLWQNQNTVVIGRNQNAWRECRISLLEQEGGRLARRTSGGGAVFHDLGNLNFTFVTHRDEYDLPRQLGVITAAVNSLSVPAEFTGRNDIVVSQSGAKFSGNAFRFSSEAGMHHGTLLIGADMQKLSRYLAPSPEKLASKGVESVRSRVCNLSDLNPAITVSAMRRALSSAFAAEYGAYETLEEAALPKERLNELARRHASWQWRCGESPRFDIELAQRFSWGELQLHLCYKNGFITEAAAYSDAMDEAMVRSLTPALLGCRFDSRDMAAALQAAAPTPTQTPELKDIAAWLLEKGF